MLPSLKNRLTKIKLLILDVDGVLTDGTLWYGEQGEVMKGFHAHDGLGMRMLRMRNIEVAVISAKMSSPLIRRLEDLKVPHRLGREDKLAALDELLGDYELDQRDVAYVGDDLIDIPVLRRVGVAITVADARPQVAAEVDWVTDARGGQGAVREITDGILEARGELDGVIAELLAPHE